MKESKPYEFLLDIVQGFLLQVFTIQESKVFLPMYELLRKFPLTFNFLCMFRDEGFFYASFLNVFPKTSLLFLIATLIRLV